MKFQKASFANKKTTIPAIKLAVSAKVFKIKKARGGEASKMALFLNKNKRAGDDFALPPARVVGAFDIGH